jgi:hypothetical protein
MHDAGKIGHNNANRCDLVIERQAQKALLSLLAVLRERRPTAGALPALLTACGAGFSVSWHAAASDWILLQPAGLQAPARHLQADLMMVLLGDTHFSFTLYVVGIR